MITIVKKNEKETLSKRELPKLPFVISDGDFYLVVKDSEDYKLVDLKSGEILGFYSYDNLVDLLEDDNKVVVEDLTLKLGEEYKVSQYL